MRTLTKVNEDLKRLLADQESKPRLRANLAYLLSFAMRDVNDIITFVTRFGLEERTEKSDGTEVF